MSPADTTPDGSDRLTSSGPHRGFPAHLPGGGPPSDDPWRPHGPRINSRYEVINELARGTTASVFRVLDRLTGHVVTLKRLRNPASSATTGEAAREARLALAHEFRLLASLRHPNIITVLDYGFDGEGHPYFTMDLAENALTIIEAGANRPVAMQIELLVQTLRALVYLHRHGIIHRDLKPPNIVVIGDQVKVLDLGLSVSRDDIGESAGFAGTLTYMAPELLQGAPPSRQSDLYAVGMIAYELFTGGYPFKVDSAGQLHDALLNTPLPRPQDRVDSRMRPLLERWLAKEPAARFEDAERVLAVLAATFDQPLVVETVATRESFLQAAPLVGRREELARLTAVVRAADAGHGAAWLVTGESGVGKSRLLDEVRTDALVAGMVVVRGQAKDRGGGPYHVWQDVMSALMLRVELSDSEASVLKAAVPGVDALLGRAVEDAPAVDPEAAQSRLLFTVEDLVRRQRDPIVIILEDLQWLGSESLRLWDWLARTIDGRRLAMFGSIRDDEAPELPKSLSAAGVTHLRRLDRDEIAELSEAMVGPVGRRPELVRLLELETEGIPFFLVEVVRALAERAGGLAAITDVGLPDHVPAGGVERVVRRRLQQVTGDALPVLETAAVVGATIRPELLQALHPQLDLDEWMARCVSAAVLERRDQRWGFAHDKLREQLIKDLGPTRRRALHRRVAEGIEQTSADADANAAALAHHWREAGEPAREAEWAQRAGMLALQIGACREAIVFLLRARELLQAGGEASPPVAKPSARKRSRRSLLDPNADVDPDSLEFRIGTIEGALADAHFRLGDLRSVRRYAEQALVHFGQRLPRNELEWILGSLQQAALRALQSLSRVRPADAARTRRVAAEIGRVYIRLAESFIYSLQPLPMLWSTLRFINHCEAAGPSVELAFGYVIGAMRAEAVPARKVSRAWASRALEIAQSTGTPRDVGYTLSRLSTVHLTACRWDEAEALISQAREIADREMDHRLAIDCRALVGALTVFSAQFERGLDTWVEAHRLSLASGNRQTEVWSRLGLGDMLCRLGRHAEAAESYESAATLVDEDAMRSEAVWRLGMLGLTKLRLGDEDGAYQYADRALSHLLATAPVIYYMQHCTAAVAETFLSLVESKAAANEASHEALLGRARQACACMRRFAGRFPLGRPHADIWDGLLASIAGRSGRAMRHWQRAITLSERLHTPFERGLAHLEIGRHLPPNANDRQYHLHLAADLFERLACAGELARVRAELSRSRSPVA